MKIVAYYRVSTAKQGQSGLGLEAQRAAVAAYCKSAGGSIVAEFTEVESGKRNSRPEIAKAIAAARQQGAVLVIAKLDRLARSVHFISGLMESGIEFVACDAPHANKLTLHVLSAVAQAEAEAISQRTKAALGALKARGVTLGNPEAVRAAKLGRAANSKAAADYAATIRPLAAKKRAAGWTLQQIAHHLTGTGVLTRRGKAWTPMAVKLLLA